MRQPSSEEDKNVWPHTDYVANPNYNNGTSTVWAIVAGLSGSAETLRHCGDPAKSNPKNHNTGAIWIVDAPPPVAWPERNPEPSTANVPVPSFLPVK